MVTTRVIRLAACFLACAATAAAQNYIISTVAGGSAPATPNYGPYVAIGTPQSIVTNSAGDAFFTSLNCVFELYPNGFLAIVAGTGRAGYSGDGGPATSAQLWSPTGLALDASGNLYIADSANNRVRRISTTGIITTVAGSGVTGFSGDNGPAVSAQLYGPAGVAVDASGNIFIADSGNNRVRKVTPAGIIGTIAGNGTAAAAGDGGLATSAQLSPLSLALDTQGNVYIADSANYRVRRVSTAGIITTIAGSGTSGYTGDGGAAVGAQISAAHQIAVDPNGNLYIADTYNSCIREVFSGAGNIATVAGIGSYGFFGDGGSAANAAFWFPFGVALDTSGDLFIADTSNYRIREVFSNGVVYTVAGDGLASYAGDGGSGTAAQLNNPQGLALDRSGNLYIADTANNVVRELLTTNVIATAAGNGSPGFSGDTGPAANGSLRAPQSVAADLLGNLFIADTGNARVRQVSSQIISTAAGTGIAAFAGDGAPATSAGLSVASVAVDTAGNLYIADPFNYRVREVLAATGNITTIAGNGQKGYAGDNGPALSASLSNVAGVAVDASGNLYIADAGNNVIRKVSASGTITTVAGNGAAGFSGDGGPALNGQFRNPQAVAVDAAGNLYIADTNNNRVRMVSAATGNISTIAGSGSYAYLGDGGFATAAGMLYPSGLAIAKSGNIYVADSGNNAFRLLTPTSQSILITAVLDSASESALPVSPGKIVVIYGSNLGPAQLAVAQPTNGAFPQQLAGTTVSFRGVSAPIYYTSATQVAAVVPYEIAGSSTVPVEVSYQGALTAAFNVPFSASSPGLFTSNSTGAGQLAALNVVDETVNSAANPVKIGQYISFYGTGEGQTTPAGVDGKLGTLTPTTPLLPVTATVGGIAATVQYKGGVYGEVAGVLQVNVQIPAGVTPGGYVPVVLTIGSASTVNGALWIAVSN